MSPRQPYPRFERDVTPGSLVYRVHGGIGGVVARIDREYHGSRPIFRTKIEGESHGVFGALREAKGYIAHVVADRKLMEKGGIR